jgi:hypothetical protein
VLPQIVGRQLQARREISGVARYPLTVCLKHPVLPLREHPCNRRRARQAYPSLRHWVSGTIFSFGGVKLEFTPEDVAILIGLPKRGLELTTGELQNVASCSILNRYFKGRSPTVDEIKSKMLEVRGRDELAEDYVRLWVMYIFAALLFTDGCQRAPRDVNVLVDNLEELKEYDWPTAIHRYTAEGISRFRNARDKTTYLKGCPVLLMVSGSITLVLCFFCLLFACS